MDYSKEPVSLSFAKALKAGDPAGVTPRDILIDSLRRIDAGEDVPSDMIIVYRQRNKEDNGWDTSYVRSGKDSQAAIGMMERAKHMLLE